MLQKTNKLKIKNGFTLIELMMGMVILSIVMIIITSVYQKNTQVFLQTDQQRDIQQNARTALDLMTAEIKQAGYIYGNISPADGGNGPAIQNAQQNMIRFNAVVHDINRDGLKDDTTTWALNSDAETITFSIPAGTTKIERNAAGILKDLTFPGVIVKDLNFEYRNSSGTVLPFPIGGNDRYDIRYIEVTLTLEKGAGQETSAAGKEKIILRSGISPPNLRQ